MTSFEGHARQLREAQNANVLMHAILSCKTGRSTNTSLAMVQGEQVSVPQEKPAWQTQTAMD